MDDSIKADAQEFGKRVREGEWGLGLLVARNVEKGKGQGRKPLDGHREVEKVSAVAFAKMAGTSDHRVRRYLDAWERAATAGLVPPALLLSPGEEVDLDVDSLPPWSDYYDSSGAGGYNGGDGRKPTVTGVTKAAKQLDDEALEEVAQAVEQERVERTVYPDKPKPEFEKAAQNVRASKAERIKADPTLALLEFGSYIAKVRFAVRMLGNGYEEFKALCDDEETRGAAHERLILLRADVEIALAEITEGSVEEALARLTVAEGRS